MSQTTLCLKVDIINEKNAINKTKVDKNKYLGALKDGILITTDEYLQIRQIRA
jgi:hypothetical protein